MVIKWFIVSVLPSVPITVPVASPSPMPLISVLTPPLLSIFSILPQAGVMAIIVKQLPEVLPGGIGIPESLLPSALEGLPFLRLGGPRGEGHQNTG